MMLAHYKNLFLKVEINQLVNRSKQTVPMGMLTS